MIHTTSMPTIADCFCSWNRDEEGTGIQHKGFPGLFLCYCAEDGKCKNECVVPLLERIATLEGELREGRVKA